MHIFSHRLSPQQAKLRIGRRIILLILAVWMLLNIGPPFTYHPTLSELRAQGSSPHRVRVSGTIVEESMRTSPEPSEGVFEISDEDDHLEVHYHGSRPDMFHDGARVVVEGRYLQDGHFEADQLALEHPSKHQRSASSPSPQLGSVAASDFSCDSVIEIPQAECEALVALYNNTNNRQPGMGWRRSDGWLETVTPCSWYGVMCKDGHVVYLGLFSNALSGPIPDLSNLTELKMLILYDNQLSGSIPLQLGNLTSLTHLRLYNNRLSGPIPDLSNLTNLTDLVLKSNRLSGPIPDLSRLTSLKVLKLSSNRLSEKVPTTIVSLNNLEPNSTDLGYNMLTASDPKVIAFLDDKDLDWAQTQTVAPAGIHVVDMSDHSVELAWTPIAYTNDGGYYEISYMTLGGLYTATISKTEDGYQAGDVSPCASDGFTIAIRTYTPAHGYRGEYVYQQNELWTDYEKVAISPLPSPAPSSPANGSSTSTVPILTWNRVRGATSYQIQIDTDPHFSSSPITRTTSLSYTSSLLSEGNIYYWHVRASNLCGDGPWSEVRQFTVGLFRLFLPLFAVSN